MKKIIYSALLMSILFSCSNKDLKIDKNVKKPFLVFNDYDGSGIKNQWNFRNEYFVMTTYDNVNLYADSNLSSEVIYNIPFAARITIIYKQNKKIEIDNKKCNWVFVRMTNYPRKFGWLPDCYLGYKNDFKESKKNTIAELIQVGGDTWISFTCKKDGSFIREVNSGISEETMVNEIKNGNIYEYNNLLWFYIESEKEFPNFFYVKDNRVFSENYYDDLELEFKLF